MDNKDNLNNKNLQSVNKENDDKGDDKNKVENLDFIPTLIIEDDLINKNPKRKIITKFNPDIDENTDNIKYVDIDPSDPLSMIFVNLINSIVKDQNEKNSNNLENLKSEAEKLEKLEKLITSDTSDTSVTSETIESDNEEQKDNDEEKDNNEYKKIEINPWISKTINSIDLIIEPNLIKINNEKNDKKVSKGKVDFASTIGDINYLNNWLKEILEANKEFSNDYSEDSIDHASSNGKIQILDWWKKANSENNIPLKYSKKAINLASRNGHIKSLDWWINSELEMKYDNDAIDYASNGCRINVLYWWINNLKKNKIRFEYSSNSLDNCRLDAEKLLVLVKWWNTQKKENNIEFKYSNEFINYLSSWNYNKVYKYLVDNSMIREDEKFNPEIKYKNPMIGFFELLGSGSSGFGQKKSRDNANISNLPEDIQKHIREKEEELNNNMLVNGKVKEYIDNLIKIPFGKYKDESIFTFIGDLIKKINKINLKHKNKMINSTTLSNESDLITFFHKIEFGMDEIYTKYLEIYNEFIDIRIKYLDYVDQILNNTIYGHDSTKKQVKCIIAQWLSGGLNKGVVIGMQGPPGVGKTTVIKGAISKCLVNFITYNLEKDIYIKLNEENNDSRPFCFMSLGGTTNGSTLVGHNITYHGATSGDIVKNLKEAGVMNPILYFDELDKISNTEHGHEISSVLTHITDPVQNEHFTDRYFSEVKIDLSKCIIVFSYNDSSKIDRILLDRIQEIKLEAIRNDEKIEICKKFLIPEICKNIGYNQDDFIFSESKLNTIITEYIHEAGVRKLKEKLQEIIRMKHLERLENKLTNTKTKILTKFITDTFADYPKITFKKISDTPSIGYINGMYATTTGIGGITVIQVKPIYHKDILGIQITGSVEKVMSESIQVAKTVAYNLLTQSERMKLIENFNDTGLHVHCPEGATPKDGPSAGAAITSAIYSVFKNKPIRNDIAITGEIDLDGNITMIGGLYAKLSGAKRAGVKLAIVPRDNRQDIEIIKRKNPILLDNNFKVKFVSHIKNVINIIL